MSKDSPRTSVLRDNDLIQKGQDDLIRRGDAKEAVAAAMWARDHDEFQRRLDALPAVTVGVKPLVWKGDSIRVTANGMGKYYSCMRMFHRQKGAGWECDEGDWHPSLEAAKAAAQADYDARILSALGMQPTVSPEQPVATNDVAALVDAFDKIEAAQRDTGQEFPTAAWLEFRAALARVKGETK